MRIFIERHPLKIIGASMLSASALIALPAMAQDDKVFFCPPAVVTGLSKPTRGIMCDAEICYDSQSPELTPPQKSFLLANGACRYLSSQEIASYWRKPASEVQRASN